MAGQRIEALRAAVQVAPDDVGIRQLLIAALEGEGRFGEAITELKIAVAQQPGDPSLRLALARCYQRDGQPGPATVILEELERTGAMTTEGWRLRGALLGGPEGPEEDTSEDADPGRIALRGPRTTPGQPEMAASSPPSGAPSGDQPERPTITFADVGGMDALKEQIKLKIVYPARQPEIYAAYGKRAGGGLLMYGPPGCGKTHLARATAGELGAAFLSVGVADVLDMWIGSSERNLHAVFETARAHRPTVIFFDEVDALAADRASFRNTAGRSVINQFLAEMDGVAANNEGLLVLAATNTPWHVDPAFRRAGRFDEVLFVPPPDSAARTAILRVLLRDRPVADVDLARVAERTDGYSGADLRGVIERALEGKIRTALKDGKISPLRTSDILDATKGFTPTTKEWFSTVRNYLLYANQSGLYDPVRPYLDGR